MYDEAKNLQTLLETSPIMSGTGSRVSMYPKNLGMEMSGEKFMSNFANVISANKKQVDPDSGLPIDYLVRTKTQTTSSPSTSTDP